MQAVRLRTPPIRVFAPSMLFVLAWLAFVSGVLPDAGLGSLFWFWAVTWPCLEFTFLVAERDLRRHGLESWSASRPIRDSLFAAAIVVPPIALLALSEDAGAAEALATGGVCGVMVFVFGVVGEVLQRRARGAEEPHI